MRLERVGIHLAGSTLSMGVATLLIMSGFEPILLALLSVGGAPPLTMVHVALLLLFLAVLMYIAFTTVVSLITSHSTVRSSL